MFAEIAPSYSVIRSLKEGAHEHVLPARPALVSGSAVVRVTGTLLARTERTPGRARLNEKYYGEEGQGLVGASQGTLARSRLVSRLSSWRR